jgi:hypothetical protein
MGLNNTMIILGAEDAIFTKFNGKQDTDKTAEPHATFKPGETLVAPLNW